MDGLISVGQFKISRKSLIIYCLATLLGISFLLGSIIHTYYSKSILDVSSVGFWIGLLNFTLLTVIVFFYKKVTGISWQRLGLGKPTHWWKSILVAIGTYGAVILFSMYLKSYILQLGAAPAIDHLLVVRQNLPLLIFALVIVWITAAFIEELVFRAFLINSISDLLGSTKGAAVISVVLSAVIFGLMHAYQGITGILITGSIGLIFGIAYIINGYRIWPLVMVHGLIDTIALINIYQLPA